MPRLSEPSRFDGRIFFSVPESINMNRTDHLFSEHRHVVFKRGLHCRLLSGAGCQGTAIRPAYRPPNPCYLTMSHEAEHAIQAAWHTNPVHLNSLLTIMTRWRRAHVIYRNILMPAYRRAWELCHRVLRKAFRACIWRVSKPRVFFAFLVTCTPRNVAQHNVWGDWRVLKHIKCDLLLQDRFRALATVCTAFLQWHIW